MEVVKAPGKRVLCCFPEHSSDNCAGDCVSDRNVSVGHESVNNREQGAGHEKAHEGKDGLPKNATNGRKQAVAFQLSWGHSTRDFLEINEDRSSEHGYNQKQANDPNHSQSQ